MKKMKRPVDLMNSAARITTASQTTGGVTARTTAEMAQTRRTVVSIPDNFFLALFICLFTLLMLCTHRVEFYVLENTWVLFSSTIITLSNSHSQKYLCSFVNSAYCCFIKPAWLNFLSFKHTLDIGVAFPRRKLSSGSWAALSTHKMTLLTHLVKSNIVFVLNPLYLRGGNCLPVCNMSSCVDSLCAFFCSVCTFLHDLLDAQASKPINVT